MPSVAHVLVHPSQFPNRLQQEFLECLRAGELNHKFLYQGLKQTQRWLALHQVYSPSRTDPNCTATYERSFRQTIAGITAKEVNVVSLGCGGGQKDALLLQLLIQAGKEPSYTPVDVSTELVLTARQAAIEAIPKIRCSPVVLDLATATDASRVLDEISSPGQAQLITFLGMIPNFEPETILPRLAGLIRPGDLLLLSANLAPGTDYWQGISRILPLYDNQLTREWLIGFLLDLGVERTDGVLRLQIEEGSAGTGLLRVAAYFEFCASREIHVQGEPVRFAAGEAFRLFFSYRHTPALIKQMLGAQELRVVNQWVTRSEEEGVFLAVRKPADSAALP